MSHAELDESEDLDDGDPAELASEYRALEPKLPALRVIGGCCGTDQRHIAAICEAGMSLAPRFVGFSWRRSSSGR